MKFKCTILITSAGRRVELIRNFRMDATALEIDLKVIAVDFDSKNSAACHEADEAFSVPPCTDNRYIDRLIELCKEHSCDFVVPTIDTELQNLSEHIDLFTESGTQLIISSPEVISLARNKLSLAHFFQENSIPVPKTGTIEELRLNKDNWQFPVILKPLDGSASKGIRHLQNPAALKCLEDIQGYIAQEFWIGVEYTVNLFFDDKGELKTAIPHRRCEVRAGEVSKGKTERHERLEAISCKIGKALKGARGPLCFQAIVRNDGASAVFEINARFGGGYPLAHRAGAPFTKWLLEENVSLSSSAHNNWKEGIIMLRYDDAFFVESNAR